MGESSFDRTPRSGSYRFDAVTGTMAAGLAANSPIFSFRWGAVGKAALIRRVSIAMMSLGTGFAAGPALFAMLVARAFTASDSAGNAVALTTNNAKKRTSFLTSLVTDARISSTAILTVGTRTLDAVPLASVQCGVVVTINFVHLPTTPIFVADIAGGEFPLCLAQDEGFVIHATVPATGTWSGRVMVDWDELTGPLP